MFPDPMVYRSSGGTIPCHMWGRTYAVGLFPANIKNKAQDFHACAPSYRTNSKKN